MHLMKILMNSIIQTLLGLFFSLSLYLLVFHSILLFACIC